MKINSENLYEYVNNLATNEKVKFKVYYDDNYVTQIYWNGENFEWESGRFTSEAFFNPIYDFEPIKEKEENKVPEKLNKDKYIGTDLSVEDDMFDKINEIIDYLKSKGE